MPQFSVIIPAYNAAAHLAATLESVLAQTCQDFEIIVIDDGSTDATAAIAARFGERVRLLTQSNGGPAKARNAGIRAAQGQFIALLDSDDLWVPEKLALQSAYLADHPTCAMVFAQAWMFTESAGQREVQQTIGFTGDPSLRMLLYGDFIPNSTVVVRRACLTELGPLNEAPELIGVEDYEYWLRLAHRFPFAGIAQPLAWYRIHSQNLMGAGTDIERGLRKALRVLTEFERQYPAVWRDTGVKRERLLARLHIRAAHASKQRGEWRALARYYAQALQQSAHPLVWRWILASLSLSRWS